MCKRSVFLTVLSFLFFTNVAFAADIPALESQFKAAPLKLQYETKLFSLADSIEKEVLGFFDSPTNVKKLEADFVTKKSNLISNEAAIWLVLFSLFFFVMRATKQSR